MRFFALNVLGSLTLAAIAGFGSGQPIAAVVTGSCVCLAGVAAEAAIRG